VSYLDVGPAAQVDRLRTVGCAGIVGERDRRNSVGCTTAARLVIGGDQALCVDVLARIARNDDVVGGRAVIKGLEAVGMGWCTVTPSGYVVNSVTGDPVPSTEKPHTVGVAVILGDNELDRNTATLKNLGSGEQSSVAMDQLADALEAYR